jgi:orotidine-5'-phosphate decarboxylase
LPQAIKADVRRQEMTFIDKLAVVTRHNNSILCVGLDTDIQRIPEFLRGHERSVVEFNRRIIEATNDVVCAYKLNLAFYEALGKAGSEAIEQTLAYIPKRVITIADAKRGDIGNTAEQYAKVFFDQYGFDAVTANPYLGYDSVSPFLERDNKCTFILALTSNKGSEDFQYLPVEGRRLYEIVIEKVRLWNTKKNCGLVVGATHPEELGHIRTLAPDLPILIPGIGTQGGNAEMAVRLGCNAEGELVIINSSRSIIYASRGKDFAERARISAEQLRDELNRYRVTQ